MKTVRNYLKQLEKLDMMINNKLVEKKQWKDIALGVTSYSDGERVQSSGNQQKMANAVDRCVDIEQEINSLIDRLVEAKKDIISTIEQLNATEYDVLHKLYIQHMTFDEVAVAKRRSKSWVTTVRGRALKNVQNILNERKNENA